MLDETAKIADVPLNGGLEAPPQNQSVARDSQFGVAPPLTTRQYATVRGPISRECKGSGAMMSESDMTFSYMVTRRSARAELRKTYRWGNRVHIALAVLFVALGLVYRDAFAVVIGIGYFVFVEAVIRRSLADYPKDGTEERWSISDDEIRVDLPSRTLTYPWSSCRGACLVDDQWVLRFPGMQSLGFPARVLTSEQRERFQQLLRERSLLG